MFKKLAEAFKSLKDRPEFDPSQFNDPVAAQTEWGALKGGGTNFKTHTLKRVHNQRMEFRCSLGMLLFGGVFFLIGVGVLGAGGVGYLKPGNNFEWGEFIGMSIFGLIFGSVGFFTLRSAMVPRVFDLAQGYYCRDRKKPEHAFDPSSIRDHVRLDDIYALQLISEYVRGNKSSYHSYELNLVLKDGTRINVVDHGGRTAILRDAEALASFLGKPLWSRL